MKIYIVRAYGGEYDSSWEHNVKAFNTKEKAEENVPEYNEHFSSLMWRISQFASNMASKVPDYGKEYDRVADAMKAKAYQKYPRYTEYRDEANVWYRIDEVEMED